MGTKDTLKFFDFCSGIGTGRLGLTNCNFECVGYSEIDKDAIDTYKVFYGNKEKNYGDLMKIDLDELPDFDLMLAGFPCQTFSIAGTRLGFEDERGQIIFGLMRILQEKHTPYFILENVKGFLSHDGGNSFKNILESFDKLGYDVYWKVLNSIDFGVPQSRERLYLIGIRKDIPHTPVDWSFSEVSGMSLRDCLAKFHEEKPIDIYSKSWQNYLNNKHNKGRFSEEELLKENYLIIDHRNSRMGLQRNKVTTLRRGNHDLFYVYHNQLYRVNGYHGLALQGFSKKYIQKAKKAKLNTNKLLSQAGNAMTIGVVTAVGNALLKSINAHNKETMTYGK